MSMPTSPIARAGRARRSPASSRPLALAVTGAAARADAPAAATIAAPATAVTADPVIQWNQALIGILNTPGAQPATIHATRSLAILHAAIYDAVDSIQHDVRAVRGLDQSAAPCRPDRSRRSRRVHGARRRLYPSQQEALGAQFDSMLAQVPNGYHKYEGVRDRRGRRQRAARAPGRRRLDRGAAGVHAGYPTRATTS